MAEFGGFEMPIQYEGILAEHNATRTAATVFDTCHMGEFLVHGPSAARELDMLVSSHVAPLALGQCRYGLLCNEHGGVIDDEITYRTGEHEFMMVVNAGTQAGDFEWLRSHLEPSTSLTNTSDATGKIDLQGPQAPGVLARVVDAQFGGLKYYHSVLGTYRGAPVRISRTGYTGEIGFELYCPAGLVGQLWDDCLASGAKPAGLGARDTLRLEMGYPLYGHELSISRNAGESAFQRAIATDKRYMGSDVVTDTTRRRDSLVGLRLDSRRAARDHDSVFDDTGLPVGIVTSGSFSPCLGIAIAMAYVHSRMAVAGTRVHIHAGKSDLPATVVPLPFYPQASGRMPLAAFLPANQKSNAPHTAHVN